MPAKFTTMIQTLPRYIFSNRFFVLNIGSFSVVFGRFSLVFTCQIEFLMVPCHVALSIVRSLQSVMGKKELLHRMERCQQELEYWRGRADQMRQVLDHLETGYLTHRTDCCLVRAKQLRAVVVRALDTVAVLEGVPVSGTETAASAGRSSPTETSSLLSASEPPSSTTSAAGFNRTVQRLAHQSKLKCTLYYIGETVRGYRDWDWTTSVTGLLLLSTLQVQFFNENMGHRNH